MKKTIRITGTLVLVILLIIGTILLVISIKGVPTYQPESVTFKVDHTPQQVENGAKLVSMLCAHCHQGENNPQLTGQKVKDIDPAFGQIYSTNITQHPETGIGNWTDAQLAYFIRTGIKPNGDFAPPYMPKLPLLSDYDLQSIIAFLKSDHSSVQPSSEEPPVSKPSLLTKILTNFVIKPHPYPTQPIAEPDKSDPHTWGKYLSTAAYGCFHCHSASFPSNDDLVPENSKGFFGGGNKLFNLEGEVVYSPNITFDNETGIAHYDESAFIQTVKWGKKPDGTMIKYPMLPYTKLEDDEIKAIYTYLKTVPAIRNDIRLLAK